MSTSYRRHKDAIQAELERLKSQGLIDPRDIVEQARDKSSVLHGCFTWDDTVAAEAYRLDQARRLLRIYVLPHDPARPAAPEVRAYVSLTPDRRNGGGYRSTAEVLSDDDLRAQLLEDALKELQVFERKYARLTELAPLFAEIRELRTKPRRRQRGDKEARATA